MTLELTLVICCTEICATLVVIVLLVLVFFSQRLRVPAADGMPYRKGES